mgnify:CR=1 FL=1
MFEKSSEIHRSNIFHFMTCRGLLCILSLELRSWPLNTFICDINGDIVSDFDFATTSVSDATSVDIAYSYSFETTGDDPNTVSLIEAAIVGTMVSTLLDCPAPSGGAGRALASASSVSTYFSQVLSQGKVSFYTCKFNV